MAELRHGRRPVLGGGTAKPFEALTMVVANVGAAAGERPRHGALGQAA